MLCDGKKHWPEIVRLAQGHDTDADEKLLRYAMEAIRLNGTFGSYRGAEADGVIDDPEFGGQVHVKRGDKVFVSFVSTMEAVK